MRDRLRRFHVYPPFLDSVFGQMAKVSKHSVLQRRPKRNSFRSTDLQTFERMEPTSGLEPLTCRLRIGGRLLGGYCLTPLKQITF
jgi:hypothetical protein